MADDPSQSVAGPITSDRNIIPPAESASSPLNRPVSTILADSPTEPKTPLADPASDYTSPVPADLSDVDSAQTDSPVATESASIASSPPISPQSPLSPIFPPVEPSIPSISSEPSVPSSPPEATSEGSIQDFSPSDQPSQVQPDTPEGASGPQAFQEPENPPQSAGIKPEPPQGTQNVPLADLDSQKSSFGDLGSSTKPISPVPSIEPVQPVVMSPSAPKTSFGDLDVKPPVEEPTINIEPIQPPKPVQPQNNTVIEAKADFSAKRQQALQTRRKKREDHLTKIIALVGQKGKISNKDVRDSLRVSQSTASDYLHSLVKDGKIMKEGKAKATIYLL